MLEPEARPAVAPPEMLAPLHANLLLNAPEQRIEAPKRTIGEMLAGMPEVVATPTPTAEPEPTVVRPGRPTDCGVIELLWYDRTAVRRIRRQPAWKAVVDRIDAGPRDVDLDDPDLGESPQDAEDRRDVFEILTLGPTSEAASIAMGSAVRADGKFVPPLVLLDASLEFSFDDVEALRALVTALTPFKATNEELRRIADEAENSIEGPWARQLSERLRRTFASASPTLSVSKLDAQVERALLDGRHYQRRTVLGAPRIRALCHTPGTKTPIPTYLPDDLAKRLPAFRTLKVRLIAEAHAQQDHNEPHPVALRALALGRVLDRTARR